MAGITQRPPACKDGQVTVFDYDPSTYDVTQEMRAVFDWDGCLIVRGMLNDEEIARIKECLHANPEFLGHSYELDDGLGRMMKMVLWKHPGDDVTGMVARSKKIVNTCEALLGDGEVYHYSSKVMMKDARTGGTHLWHQDYGYFYQSGCLRPDILTVYMPLDKCVKENGCLQVVKGTHRCGRIDHCLQGGQTAADQTRVDELLKHFDHVYAELIPGDVLFFHSNLLHRAEKNDSDMRRWAMLSVYCRADNDPIYKHHCPNYTKLHKKQWLKDAQYFLESLPKPAVAGARPATAGFPRNTKKGWGWSRRGITQNNQNLTRKVYLMSDSGYIFKVSDSDILECTNMTDLTGKDFLDPKDDRTINISLKASGYH